MSSNTRALVAIAGLLASACQQSADSPMVTLVEQGRYEDVWEEYLSTVRPGPNGGVIAEGDRYFPSEDALRADFDARMLQDVDKAHAFQRDSDDFVPKFPFSTQRNIRYCVSDAFGLVKPTIVTAMAEATRNWASIANLRFIYVSSLGSACTGTQTGVEFAVVKTANSGGYFANNKLMWSGLEGPSTGQLGVLEVDTNLDITFGGDVPNMTLAGMFRHEIGHVLALRHEHPWRPVIDLSCGERPKEINLDLDGLALNHVTYDRDSVMHWPFFDVVDGLLKRCGGNPQSSYSFTRIDIYSIQRLYGMHPAWSNAANTSVMIGL